MGRKKFRDRWYVDGKQVQTTYDTREERDKGRAKRLLGATPDQPLLKPVTTTFKELTHRWVEDYSKLSKAAGQAAQDKSVSSVHMFPIFGDVVITKLNEGHLKAMRIEMQRKGLRPKTIRNAMALAKAILQTATESHDGSPPLISNNPFAKVKLEKVGKQPFDYWTPDERDTFIRLVKQQDPEFAKLVALAAFTGLRRGELAGLERRHLDFERRQIQVSDTYNFITWEKVATTKNGDADWVPMNDVAYEWLKDCRLMAPGALVFKRRYLLDRAAQKLATYAKAFGIRVIRFHDLRHTFASCLAMVGVPLFDIQKLMRHKKIEQTQRYAHLSPQYLHESSNALCRKRGPNEGHDKTKLDKLSKEQEESWWRVSDSNRKGA